MHTEEIVVLDSPEGEIYLYATLPEETNNSPYQEISRTEEKPVSKIKQSVDDALRGLKALITQVKDLGEDYGPDEVSIEAGLKYDTGVNAFVLKAGTEVNLTVKLTWKSKKEEE